jgi:hypothetical protein
MTTMEPTPRQVAVKVSPKGDRLITSGTHYVRTSKKDFVEAAVEFYLTARREEMQGKLSIWPRGSYALRLYRAADGDIAVVMI